MEEVNKIIEILKIESKEYNHSIIIVDYIDYEFFILVSTDKIEIRTLTKINNTITKITTEWITENELKEILCKAIHLNLDLCDVDDFSFIKVTLKHQLDEYDLEYLENKRCQRYVNRLEYLSK